MTIKELYGRMQDFIKNYIPLNLDNSNVLAVKRTVRGIETAEIIDFYYNGEIDSWVIEVKDWESEQYKPNTAD